MTARLTKWLKQAAFSLLPADMLVVLKGLLGRGPEVSAGLVVHGDAPAARVLVLAPHPDDEVVGAGGTLALHLARGNSVLVVYMTDDEAAAGTRVREARALGAAVGLDQAFLGGRDGALAPEPGLVARVAELLTGHAPTQIFVPWPLDAHPDHRATARILAGALAAAPQCDAAVFGYEVWSCLPQPNCVFDITPVADRKLAMLAHYPSQTGVVDFTSLCAARGRMRHLMHVDSRGGGHAEAFCCWPAGTFQELAARNAPEADA